MIDSERFNPTPVHARGAALSGRAGFSLVELLVVIAVVGVLVSILMPALAAAKKAGRAAVCSSNVRQLALANAEYANDYAECYAPAMAERAVNLRRWHGARTSPGLAFTPEGGSLTPYLGSGDRASLGVRTCPEFTPAAEALVIATGAFERSCGGYGYNSAYVGTRLREESKGAWSILDDRCGSPAHQFRSPERTIAFADAAFAGGVSTGSPDGLIEYSFVEPRFWPQFPNERADPSMHFRHGKSAGSRVGSGSAQVAYLDGHAESAGRTKVWSSGFYDADPAPLGIGWTGTNDDNALFDFE